MNTKTEKKTIKKKHRINKLYLKFSYRCDINVFTVIK